METESEKRIRESYDKELDRNIIRLSLPEDDFYVSDEDLASKYEPGDYENMMKEVDEELKKMIKDSE